MFTSTIIIEGRLVEYPTVLENLTEIVVLTNRRRPNDAGECTSTDTRYVVKTFKTPASKAGEQLHKGDQVIVAGSIVTDTWADKDSQQNRYRRVVLADAIGTPSDPLEQGSQRPLPVTAAPMDGRTSEL
jgi:single-stranded DNA-binding protein